MPADGIETVTSRYEGDWAFQWIERESRKRWSVAYSRYTRDWLIMVNVYVPTPTGELTESYALFPKNWEML